MVSALAAAPVLAENGPGGSLHSGSGSSSGQTLSASVSSITYDTSKNGSGSGAGPIAAEGDWTPPPCWYEPTYTPQQFAAENKAIWAEPSVGSDWSSGQQQKYQKGKPYKNFNIGKSGYWWTGVPNPAMLADPASLDCTEHDPFWVPTGAAPPVANSISPRILAELAYQRIHVPNTRVTLSPNGKQTVNLNTWAWLNKATFKPVSVTASLPRLNISATATATPVSLHIDPGTQDANVYPASGDCPISANGSIGTPYSTADGNGTPPCGMTYLRATSDGAAYQFKATITWKVAWTGTGGGGALPNGTFGATTPVTVQEVQTVVR